MFTRHAIPLPIALHTMHAVHSCSLASRCPYFARLQDNPITHHSCPCCLANPLRMPSCTTSAFRLRGHNNQPLANILAHGASSLTVRRHSRSQPTTGTSLTPAATTTDSDRHSRTDTMRALITAASDRRRRSHHQPTADISSHQ